MSSQLHARKRVKYAPEQMQRAIDAVRSGSMSKKAASTVFGVPRTTLLDKLSGRVPESATPPGKKPTLTQAEEKALVDYSKLMFEIGYPLTVKEFLKQVKYVLDVDGRPTPFKNNLPGYHWFELFSKRNPQMSMRTPMSLGQERARVNMEMVRGWFEGVITFLKKEVPDYERLLKDPRRVFNADESGFPLCVKPNRVMAPKGVHNVYQVVTNTKVQITVMAAFNAYGDYVPPLILFPGERLRDIGLSDFPEARYAATKSGWMDSETFLSFLHLLVEFVSDKGITFPILLFVDGHSTHVTLAAAEYCKANHVILYCLLPNATHILQACDIGFFSPMKKVWQQTVKDWQVKNIGTAMTKKEFPGLLKITWDRVATIQNAANGFKKSGLFPFNVDAVDANKTGPSKLDKPAPVSTVTTEKASTEPVENVCSEPTSQDQNPANTIAEEQPPPTVEPQPSTSAQEGCVAPAFMKLQVPEPKEKRKIQRLSEKLPKAISGADAIKLLKEREEKRKTAEQEKLQRKEQRARKKVEKELEKAKKDEEKARRQEEREKIRREKEAARQLKIKIKNLKKKRKMCDQNDDSDSAADSFVSDVDSSDFEEEFEMCPACNRGDKHPSLWGKCLECATRWHYDCANRPEFQLLDEEERKKLDFICPLCT